MKSTVRYVDARPEEISGKGDLYRTTQHRCKYCLEKTDEPLIRQGLGMKCRVCLECKKKRGIK